MRNKPDYERVLADGITSKREFQCRNRPHAIELDDLRQSRIREEEGDDEVLPGEIPPGREYDYLYRFANS